MFKKNILTFSLVALMNHSLAQTTDEVITQANNGDMTAQFTLATWYQDGYQVEFDLQKAKTWFEQSAEQGHYPAQVRLAQMYDIGIGVEASETLAKQWGSRALSTLTPLAESGDANAQNELAALFQSGNYTEKSESKAAMWYLRAAEQGNHLAQRNLAYLYEQGKGVEQSYEQAAKWYQKSAEQNFDQAQYALADLYANGQGVEQSDSMAFALYQEVAENPDSIYKNRATEKAQAIEEKFIQQQAETGDTDAQVALSLKLIKQHQYTEALGWLEKAKKNDEEIAQGVYEQLQEHMTLRKKAEQGDQESIRELAFEYHIGMPNTRVPRDLIEAQKWWEKLATKGDKEAANLAREISQYLALKTDAELGDKNAQLTLAKLYDGSGEDSHLIADDDMAGFIAISWYRKAAENGHPEAQTALGWLYLDGNGVEMSIDTAIMWFKKAATQSYPDAYLGLGKAFFHQIDEMDNVGLADIEHAYQQAKQWYEKAQKHAPDEATLGLAPVEKVLDLLAKAKQNDAEAQFKLASAFDRGKVSAANQSFFISQKTDIAIGLYHKAAEQEQAIAQNNLGVIYEEGDGVEPDMHKAITWYKRSANNGYALGQYNLALLYLAGSIPENDPSLAEKSSDAVAIHWLNQSATQGYPAAQDTLGQLYAKGRGVKKSLKNAIEWTEKAVKNNQSKDKTQASYHNNLAKLYAQQPEHQTQATKHFTIAAQQNDAEAMYHLAQHYLSGKGIEKNLVNSYAWATLASFDDKNRKNSQTLLKQLKKQMTKEEINQANDMVLTLADSLFEDI